VDIDVDVMIGSGRVVSLPVPITQTDLTLMTGGGSILGWSLRDAANEVATDVSGSVVAPGAGATIVTTGALAAGTYNIAWAVGLAGPAALADTNNFQLKSSSGNILVSINPGVAGTYPQANAQVTIPTGATISVVAIVAGTAGVTYSADVAVTPTVTIDAVVEIQDAGQQLAEVSMGANGSSSQDFARPGIHVRSSVIIHVVSGTVTGTVFVDPYC